MRRKDILAYVGRQMVVADKLLHLQEHFPGRGEEGSPQVVNDGQGQSPVAADIPQHFPNLVMVSELILRLSRTWPLRESIPTRSTPLPSSQVPSICRMKPPRLCISARSRPMLCW